MAKRIMLVERKFLKLPILKKEFFWDFKGAKLLYEVCRFFIFPIIIFNYALSWQRQISPRTDRNLFDIWFVSESIGCACGNFGFLIRTTDAGANWQDRSGVTNNWIDDMWFADSRIGYAVGEAGTILKTTDGGENWFLLSCGLNFNLYGVCFPDTDNGWITGQGGIICHTSDGGITWSPQNSGTTLYIFDIEFVNADTGWACGQNGWVYKTSNGGNNWTRLNIAGSDLYGLKCVSGTELWVAGANGKIYRISDFGNNVQSWQVSSGTLKAVEVKGNRIWVCGQFGTIVFSPNYGDTWIQQTCPTNNYLDEIFFWDENRGWIVGMAGTILYTQNGGVGLIENFGKPKANFPNIQFTGKKYTLWTSAGQKIQAPFNALPSGVYFITTDNFFQPICHKVIIVR
ncbi:MAG: YCF48-related protein [candidate division WOR-3 bacterium]